MHSHELLHMRRKKTSSIKEGSPTEIVCAHKLSSIDTINHSIKACHNYHRSPILFISKGFCFSNTAVLEVTEDNEYMVIYQPLSGRSSWSIVFIPTGIGGMFVVVYVYCGLREYSNSISDQGLRELISETMQDLGISSSSF